MWDCSGRATRTRLGFGKGLHQASIVGRSGHVSDWRWGLENFKKVQRLELKESFVKAKGELIVLTHLGYIIETCNL